MLTSAVAAVFYTYWKTEGKRLLNAVGNVLDLCMVVVIIGAVIVTQTKLWDFTTLEYVCFSLTAAALVLYWTIGSKFASNMIVQVAMITAFVPNYATLWGKVQHGESYMFWIFIICQASSAIPPATIGLSLRWEDRDTWIQPVYLVRGIVLVSITIVLMILVDLGVWE